MARGLNLVQIIGTLTRDPELKFTAAGLAVLNLQLAGNESILGSDGQNHEIAWYHRVTSFGRSAEIAAEQLKQGDAVFVEGRLNFRSWDDPQGQKRSSLDITGVRIDALSYGMRKDKATVQDSLGQPRLLNALNQISLVGNLTRDAELRYTPNGHATCRMTIAVNENFRDRTGNDQERVHYIDIQTWRELAEGCAELVKGDPVYVQGRLVNDSWVDKDGSKRYVTRVEAMRVEFLNRGPGSGGTATRPAAARTQPMSAVSPASAVSAQTSQGKTLDIDEEFPPEEDLPF
ncbi:MAG: single-stranded DNA-binding protein [Deinococcales bacterium]